MHVVIAALHRPTKPTGVCRHAVNLANCLSDKADIAKITLLIGSWQKNYFARVFNILSQKIEIKTIDIKNSSTSRNLWFLFGLPKVTNRLNADLVHLSFPLPVLRNLFNSPVVATIHDFYPYECPENFGYPNVLFNQWFLQQCIQNSDGLACVSNTTLGQLEHYFPKAFSDKNTSVLYNYVDFEDIQAAIPASQQPYEHQPFILCVAQHRKNKNLDLLVQAYADLLKKNSLPDQTRLILVGSAGPESQNLNTLSQKLGVDKQMHMLSAISDRELCWLYENCLLFAMPSSTEGFCIPLVEALSRSCHIVCSNIPIFRELGLTECVFFNLTGNAVTNLSAAIKRAAKKPKLVQNTDNIRFSKTVTANQCLTLYYSLLEQTIVK